MTIRLAEIFSPNMHPIDRGLRALIGVACLYVAIYDPSLIPNALVSVLVGVFGAMNVVSAMLAHCPVYRLGGIRTNSAPE